MCASFACVLHSWTPKTFVVEVFLQSYSDVELVVKMSTENIMSQTFWLFPMAPSVTEVFSLNKIMCRVWHLSSCSFVRVVHCVSTTNIHNILIADKL